MAKSSTFDSDLLKLIFNGTTIGNIADNAAGSPLTNLYVALHTADPTAAGTQTSSEAAYTGYARVAVARTAGGWTVTGAVVNPAANITFPACTGGTSAVTYWSVGTASSGAGKVLYSGAVTPSITVTNGITPYLNTTTNITEA